MTNDKVLEIRNLTKKYKDKVVFSEINLDFYRKKNIRLGGKQRRGQIYAYEMYLRHRKA